MCKPRIVSTSKIFANGGAAVSVNSAVGGISVWVGARVGGGEVGDGERVSGGLERAEGTGEDGPVIFRYGEGKDDGGRFSPVGEATNFPAPPQAIETEMTTIITKIENQWVLAFIGISSPKKQFRPKPYFTDGSSLRIPINP